jgi:hypothetical protein
MNGARFVLLEPGPVLEDSNQLGLPIARAQAGHGIGWRQLQGQSVYLGKWFRLMAPQDPVATLEPEPGIDIARKPGCICHRRMLAHVVESTNPH